MLCQTNSSSSEGLGFEFTPRAPSSSGVSLRRQSSDGLSMPSLPSTPSSQNDESWDAAPADVIEALALVAQIDALWEVAQIALGAN